MIDSIFVEGCKAFAEDMWATFTIDKVTFHGVKIRGRCKVQHLIFVIFIFFSSVVLKKFTS